MIAIRTLFASVVAGLALGAAPASAALVTRDIKFTASDGVVLHATIGGENDTTTPRPLIVEDSPYAPAVTAPFGPAYNYLQLQWRGTGRSGGSLSSTDSRDQQDLSEFVTWACEQPFSNGRIGIYGFSASAIVAYNTMHRPLPCVKAAALMAGGTDLYRDLLYIGGINHGAAGLFVLAGIGAPALQNGPARFADGPQTIPNAIKGFVTTPVDVLSHSTEDEYWLDRTFKGNPNNIPILADTGFYDVEARGPFLAYRETRAQGSHLLVIGAHDGFAGESGGPFPHYTRWFDHFVREIDNGIDREPPVSLYLSNGSRERLLGGDWTHLTGSDWPLPGTQWTRLYLSADKSNTARSLNDGTLRLAPAAAGSQTYPVHPSNAFATDPHTTATVAGMGVDAFAAFFPQFTQMDLAEPTALTYTTPPLTKAINAVGPASLDVFVSSTAPESDLLGVVADVWPDGTAHAVATGQLKTAFPNVDAARSLTDPATGDLVQPYNDFSAKDQALPGTTREYHIEMPPIGNHFAEGHRIRLYVIGTAGYFQPGPPGANTVTLGGVQGSRLLLPTAQGPSVADALP